MLSELVERVFVWLSHTTSLSLLSSRIHLIKELVVILEAPNFRFSLDTHYLSVSVFL
jgi:hypothetical protein